jgi:putative oxidoreductase
MMYRLLNRHAAALYAMLRIVAGALFLLHGTQKLFGFPPPLGRAGAPPFLSLFGAAGVIETVAGFMILAGLQASDAAFVASGEMAFAYFLAHFPRSVWPTNNLGEPAILNCFLFLYVAAMGSGRFSLDSLRGQASRRFGADS